MLEGHGCRIPNVDPPKPPNPHWTTNYCNRRSLAAITAQAGKSSPSTTSRSPINPMKRGNWDSGAKSDGTTAIRRRSIASANLAASAANFDRAMLARIGIDAGERPRSCPSSNAAKACTVAYGLRRSEATDDCANRTTPIDKLDDVAGDWRDCAFHTPGASVSFVGQTRADGRPIGSAYSQCLAVHRRTL